MKYWLHRISHEWDISKRLLDMGYLTIGWAKYSNTLVSYEFGFADTSGFERAMIDLGERSRGRWGLHRFLSMRAGDVVVVPLRDGQFAVADIAGSAKSITELNVEAFLDIQPSEMEKRDIGFFVPVRDITVRKRSYAEADLQSRMKMRQTNGDITELKESVDRARTAAEPVNLHDVIIDSAVESILSTIKKHIRPDKLEHLVKWYMNRVGASRVYKMATNEAGKSEGADGDVVAEFDPLSIVIYIQVKCHEGETNNWAVEQIRKYKEQKETVGDGITYIPWVISTALFSSGTREEAIEAGVRLIDGPQFARMLADAGISDINDFDK